jgi:hypothetical protein
MFTIYVHNKFHVHSSNTSLVTAIKPRAAMLLFYILQKVILIKAAHFLEIYYHTSFQNPKLSVASTSRVHHIVTIDFRKLKV